MNDLSNNDLSNLDLVLPLREIIIKINNVDYDHNAHHHAHKERIVSIRTSANFNAKSALPTLILLHGIGSSSASWIGQLSGLTDYKILAWDAPGYGLSSQVTEEHPDASNYADILRDLLNTLNINKSILIGHSLGALMAANFAARYPECVSGLLLLSPAQGYGKAALNVREEKRLSRLNMLEQLGPQAMAQTGFTRMLGKTPNIDAIKLIQYSLARINISGYRQATHLLADADILTDLAQYKGTRLIAVGLEDSITPPEQCRNLANITQTPFSEINHAGHACYIEQTQQVNQLIMSFVRGIISKN
ncbi:reactive intermediate detoxifying aminoacrylate hydrolase [Gammaproteobacteria bacterium]|nr:reactive intermediate detoxifying aminoacrylate hydrolase [Gammaproteobacteria bacterium]